MRRGIFLLAWCVFAALGCGTGEKEPVLNTGSAQSETSKESNKPGKTPVSPPALDPKKDSGKTVTGKATWDAVRDGGQAQDGNIRLVLSDTGDVTGSLSLEGVPISLTGVKQQDTLRLWAALETEDLKAVRRGYMFGIAKDGLIEGFFTISGNGGEPRLSGSWNAR